MINYQTARRKLNRRRSSVFIPEQPSILQKMTHIISNAAQTFSTRYGLHHATNTAERIVIPNYQVDYTIQRCKLYNYQTYCGNKIKTTKYGLITFIPKNLWEQFHRIANLYFILIAAMNWIPVLEAVDPYLPMLPVLIVFGLTALKDAYSDFCRGKLDRQVNRSFCHVWDREENRFRKMHWEDVIVGDFLHISLNEIIPADILLIRSSDPDGNCFLETSNLDGETSLKPRYVPPSLLEHSGEEILHHPVDFCTKISCEKPNNRIYQMKGYIIRNNKITETISSENMLLRGCQLRNTAFIEGIVLYAGSETKVMMSSSDPSYKRSSLEVATNCFILHCILILISMCLLTGIASIFWLSSYLSNIRKVSFIILNGKSIITNGIIITFSSILNYQTLIPLSLYISVEFIKLFQIYFISQDITMYDAYRDRVTECRSLNIPEELGCIQYIMSDKTGTLTENLMMFRGCAIGGVNYTCEPRPGDSGNLRVDNVMVNSELKDRVEVMNWHTDRILMDFFITMALCNTIVVNTKSHVERGLIKNDILDVDHDMKIEQNRVAGYSKILRDTEMWNLTKKVYFDKWSFLTRWSKFARKSKSTSGFVCDASCSSLSFLQANKPINSMLSLGQFSHSSNELTEFSEKKSSTEMNRWKRNEDYKELVYEGESADELALAYAARAYGIKLLKRSKQRVVLILPQNNNQAFDILRLLPFDSTRKKMSIIVRMNDEITLYCKGADSEILNSLSDCKSKQSITVQLTKEILKAYSMQGLRTLCLAKRHLTLTEYEQWMMKHTEIENNVGSLTYEKELHQSFASIESNLEFLGVTAVEDKLQDGVEDTIVNLRKAGIQIWLLTGDKMETAVNIARSCGLFPPTSTVYMLNTEDDVHEAHKQILTHNNLNYCIVLSSDVLFLFVKQDSKFLHILQRSISVLCHRMTPSNKAKIVRIAKEVLHGGVLAIGDGANDVPMIQCADVGIGVYGQEGLQAAMAADFAVARFKFLLPLLLVHGHWCYDRLARTLLYFLYKNALFVFVIFWYQFFAGFSGTLPMDPIYAMLYTFIFTGAQPLAFGIYEQVIERKCLEEKPELYSASRSRRSYRNQHFWLNVLDAFWQSSAIFFIATTTYWNTTVSYRNFGFLLSTSIFMVNIVHLALEIRRWTLPMVLVNVFSIAVHFSYFRMMDWLTSLGWQLFHSQGDISIRVLATVNFWAVLVLTVLVAIFPRLIVRVIMNSCFPSELIKASLRRRNRNFASLSSLCNDLSYHHS